MGFRFLVQFDLSARTQKFEALEQSHIYSVALRLQLPGTGSARWTRSLGFDPLLNVLMTVELFTVGAFTRVSDDAQTQWTGNAVDEFGFDWLSRVEQLDKKGLLVVFDLD